MATKKYSDIFKMDLLLAAGSLRRQCCRLNAHTVFPVTSQLQNKSQITFFFFFFAVADGGVVHFGVKQQENNTVGIKRFLTCGRAVWTRIRPQVVVNLNYAAWFRKITSLKPASS